MRPLSRTRSRRNTTTTVQIPRETLAQVAEMWRAKFENREHDPSLTK